MTVSLHAGRWQELGAPFPRDGRAVFWLHEGVGVHNSAAHTLIVIMAQFKASTFRMRTDLITYPDTYVSGMSLEGQPATLHVDNWNSLDHLAHGFISRSQQVIFKIDQDGVRVFNELCVRLVYAGQLLALIVNRMHAFSQCGDALLSTHDALLHAWQSHPLSVPLPYNPSCVVYSRLQCASLGTFRTSETHIDHFPRRISISCHDMLLRRALTHSLSLGK